MGAAGAEVLSWEFPSGGMPPGVGDSSSAFTVGKLGAKGLIGLAASSRTSLLLEDTDESKGWEPIRVADCAAAPSGNSFMSSCISENLFRWLGEESDKVVQKKPPCK
jgi:hypothetical protein